MTGHSEHPRRAARAAGAGWRIGIDIGGTFTDLVALDRAGTVVRRKVASTPRDYSAAIRTGLADLMREAGVAPADVGVVVHGTTVATNAILEGRGGRTALITTSGFRDVLELRRIRVPELYNFSFERPPPLVPRRLRFEVRERIGPDGAVMTPMDLASAEQAVARVKASGVEALAIAFLHAYANPAHERHVARLARRRLGRGVFISCSADILAEIREYERTSTAVINAYVGPVVAGYLAQLSRVLRELGIAAPLQIMQSSGGVIGAAAVRTKPAFIVESGPAAGVVGGAELARRAGQANVITVDMGGTTAKASMVEDGQVTRTSEYEVGAGINVSSQLTKGRGHALKLPVVDVSEIGAGGGSIARVDRSGLLRVGPESAGADPGPVCYGLGGTRPTLTDAMVVLGYVNPSHLVGGSVRLDAVLSRQAIEAQIAGPLGRSVLDAAHGIYVIAAAVMTRAVKAVSTYRGRDPRDFRLVAFGGNGPLVAAEIAAALHIREIVVPQLPGLFSALGLLMARPEQGVSRTLFRRTTELRAAEIGRVLAGLEARARRALIADGCPPDETEIARAADLRYAGQAYELTVPVPAEAQAVGIGAALAEAFGEEHRRTYGHRAVDEPVDLVSLRVTATQRANGLAALPSALLREAGADGAASRDAYFGPARGVIPVPVTGRVGLAGAPRSGPLIVEEYDSTCLVPPGWSARLDALGNIVMAAE